MHKWRNGPISLFSNVKILVYENKRKLRNLIEICVLEMRESCCNA